jgi:hypothetical protein
VRHVLELPDEEVGQEFDIEDDEPTVPDGGWLKLPSLSDLYANKGQIPVPNWIKPFDID